MGENMRAWLSLANTVLVSIAMVIWYFAIWQEEKEEIDESKIIIIEDEKERKGCEIDKNTKGIKDDKGEFENLQRNKQSKMMKLQLRQKKTSSKLNHKRQILLVSHSSGPDIKTLWRT